MKRKISKEEYEKLSDVMKAEYELKGDSYLAKIEGDDEAVEALRIAKENEKTEHGKTKTELKKLRDEMEALTGEKHKKDGNIEALEASYKQKLTDKEAEFIAKNSKLTSMLSNSMIDSAINSLAGKLIKPEAQNLFRKSIKDRFQPELEGETPALRILDKSGKVSASTLEDLEKELLADKEYSSIIIASRASGGIGDAGKPRNGVPLVNVEGKPVLLNKLSTEDFVSHLDTIVKHKD